MAYVALNAGHHHMWTIVVVECLELQFIDAAVAVLSDVRLEACLEMWREPVLQCSPELFWALIEQAPSDLGIAVNFCSDLQ